ncbi:MAG: hypothetical protein ABI728_08830 [Betaproteobacteria bacterium]
MRRSVFDWRQTGCPRKRHTELLALLAVALSLPGVSAVSAQSRQSEPLTAAVNAGTVTAIFRGLGVSSGYAVQVTVRKTPKAGAGTLVLSLPAGTQLRSTSGEVQNMVIARVRGRMIDDTSFTPTSDLVVSGPEPVTYVLEAYCSEFEKDNPSGSSVFALSSLHPGLACILREGRGLSTEAMQAAVWIHTDRVTYAGINTKFTVTSTDWAQAQAVAGKCPREE